MSVIAKVKDLVRRRPRQLSLEDYLAKQISKGIDPKTGQIKADPTPIAPPIGYKKHPSMVELVRDMVRSEKLAAAARDSGHETFEESEDFEVGDEPELMRSPWENQFEPSLAELLQAGEEELARRSAAAPAPASSEVPLKAGTPPEGAKSPPAAEVPPKAE